MLLLAAFLASAQVTPLDANGASTTEVTSVVTSNSTTSPTSDLAFSMDTDWEQAALQQFQMREAGWKPDLPFDLGIPEPETPVIQEAIMKGLEYILERQRDNGSWDVTLTGALLSNTADDAIDAITITSMCGLALRKHFAYAPELIEPALHDAANFVMDRIIRGKLSTAVFYAIWRYSFGLRFLMSEYRASEDEEFRDRCFGVCRRMVSAVLSMQNSNNKRSRLQRKRKLRVDRRGSGFSATTGIVCQLPTDEDFKGGAPVLKVLEGSGGEDAGVKVGDRIVELAGLKIENAYDFYLAEADFVEDMKKIPVKLYRNVDGERKIERLRIDIPAMRPGTMGMILESYQSMIRIAKFMPLSAAEAGGLEVGDYIAEVDGEEVKSVEDVLKIDNTLEAGKSIKVRYYKKGDTKKLKSKTLKASKRPDGWMGFWPNDEDKGDANGVDVLIVESDSVATELGIGPGDRITHINDYEILGYDHYAALESTLYAGQQVKVKFIDYDGLPEWARSLIGPGRDQDGGPGEKEKEKAPDSIGPDENARRSSEDNRQGDPKEVTAVLAPRFKPGMFQFSMIENWNVDGLIITEVDRKSNSAKAGIKKGDILVQVDDIQIKHGWDWELGILWTGYLKEGVRYKLTVKRGSKDYTFEVVAAGLPEEMDYEEEGGWAYYKNPHAPSFVTAAVILNLEEVLETFDKALTPEAKKGIKEAQRSGTKALAHLRVADPKTDEHSYTYDIRFIGDGPQYAEYHDIRGGIGRIMVGDLALTTQREIGKNDLKSSLKVFFKYREELDRVRTFPITHNYDRWANAAYYWLFGHYYAAQSANAIGGSGKKKAHTQILRALMQNRRENGLWLGHEGFGVLCATAHALMIFGELEGDFRQPGDVKPSITQSRRSSKGSDDKDDDKDKEEENTTGHGDKDKKYPDEK